MVLFCPYVMEQEGTGKDVPGIVSLSQTQLLNPAWSSAVLPRLQQQDLGRKGNCLQGAGVTEHPNPTAALKPPWASSGQPLALAVGHQLCLLSAGPAAPLGAFPEGAKVPWGAARPAEGQEQGPGWCSSTPMGARKRVSVPSFPAGWEHWHIFRRFVLPVNPSLGASAVD